MVGLPKESVLQLSSQQEMGEYEAVCDFFLPVKVSENMHSEAFPISVLSKFLWLNLLWNFEISDHSINYFN